MPGDDGHARGHGATDMNLSALPATAVGDTSIIAEAAPSELAPEFDETRLPGSRRLARRSRLGAAADRQASRWSSSNASCS